MSTQTETAARTRNGWSLDAFHGAIEAVRDEPKAGRLTFHGRVDWDGGFAGDARPREIEQLGETMPRSFTMRGDHPPELLGHDTGPTAVETLLAALGACVMGTYAAHATARGVELEALRVEVEGAIDLAGFFGIRPVPPGLSDVRLIVHVRSTADPATLSELADVACAHSPVYQTVAGPVAMSTTVRRLA